MESRTAASAECWVLSFAAATESRTTGAMVFLAPIVAMTSPQRAILSAILSSHALYHGGLEKPS
jgi:hypothetical protein